MTITIQVAPGARSATDLGALAAELGVSLTPMHPGSSDPVLRSYFTVEVSDAAAAQHVAARLRQSPAVAAAYIKPPDAMP